jgi:hypothetical protein
MRSALVIRVWTAAVVMSFLIVGVAAAQAPLPSPEVLLFAGVANARAPLPAPEIQYPIKGEASVSPDAAKTPQGIGQIEIYDGPRRTVQFVAPNLSPGERSSLRDLSRAENEAAYADELLALRRDYVNSERILEPLRRNVQQQLFGLSTESNYSGFVAGGWGNRLGAYNYGYNDGFGGGFAGGASTSVSRSLANSVGYEGPLKDAMARQIASQATPDFAAGAARDLDLAMGRAASSERVAKGFGVARGEVKPAAATSGHVILTLKSGEKLEGNLYGEDAEWFRVETPTSTVSVRKGDVSRVEVPKK